ncbi:MAG: N-acetylmuramoyl-L-alanine amidase [Patescibacteria group bacterium]
MKKFLIALGLLFLLSACQNFDPTSLVVEVPAQSSSASFTSPLVKAPDFNAFFFKFRLIGSGTSSASATAWFEPAEGSGQLAERDLGIECENSECSGFAVAPLSQAWKFQIKISGEAGTRASNFSVEAKNLSAGRSLAANFLSNLLPVARAQLDELGIVSRQEWGADESLLVKFNDSTAGAASSAQDAKCTSWQQNSPEDFRNDGRLITTTSTGEELQWPRTYSTEIKKIIVHHSAESGEKDLNGDNKFDKEDAEIIVQAIYYYHARTRGWGDIGYNFLIDPLGNIYEGRSGGDYVVGGHTYCANTNTIGVAFIGNFQNEIPSEEALESGARLLGDLSNFYDLPLDQFSDFHGKNTRNLIGHRDYGATACPGQKLYDYLPSLAAEAMTWARGNKISDADYDFSIIEKESPLNLKPFEAATATFRLKNVGRKAWPAGSKIVVARAEILRNKNGVSIAGGSEFAVDLSSEVSSGSTAVLKIPLAAAATPGRYRFGLALKIGDEELRKFYLVVNVLEPQKLDYALVNATWPPQPFAPGTTADAFVQVQNKSDFTWKASGSSRMVLQTSDGSISIFTNSAIVGYLESDTPPGSIGRFKMRLTAPKKAERYYLEFKPAARGGLVLPDYGMQFHISVREPRFSGDLISKSSGTALRFEPGQTKNLSLEFRNTSQIDWNPDSFELKILKNDGVKIANEKLKLPSVVAKNAVVKIEFPVTASNKAGKYLFTLQPRWVSGKIKEMAPVDFSIEVNPPRLMGELVSQPQTFNLQKGATADVEIKLKNTGNVVWNSRDVLLQTLPAEPSKLATKTWLSPTQPAKLVESSVSADGIGTFRFTIQKSSDAAFESLRVVPMLRGLGRIRGKEITLEINSAKSQVTPNPESVETSPNSANPESSESSSNSESSETQSSQPQAQNSELATQNSSEPNIRIKLDFESPQISIGGGPFAIQQYGKTLFQGSFADFSAAKLKDGEFVRVIPSDGTILEIPSWWHPNWNGKVNYNKFRGILEVRRMGETLVIINELPLEIYLDGIAEASPSDPIEKKKLMAVLARSYALYYVDPAHRKFPGKAWDGDDSPARFQQYFGYNYELSGGFADIVAATRGEVVTFDGHVVKTPYFTSSDGITKTSVEAGWGAVDFQFVKKVEDPWSCGGTLADAGIRCPENARGHGVGVSGKGAAGLAKEGKTYKEIADYFFNNIKVEKVY